MMHRIFFAFIWIIGRVLLWIYRVDVKGLESLPKHSVLLCPNHSTDLDPVLIGLCLPLDYHLHCLGKAELFDHRALDMGDVVPCLKSIDETFKHPEVIKEWI